MKPSLRTQHTLLHLDSIQSIHQINEWWSNWSDIHIGMLHPVTVTRRHEQACCQGDFLKNPSCGLQKTREVHDSPNELVVKRSNSNSNNNNNNNDNDNDNDNNNINNMFFRQHTTNTFIVHKTGFKNQHPIAFVWFHQERF